MDYKVTYESKEYNLNAVLSFDLLKHFELLEEICYRLYLLLPFFLVDSFFTINCLIMIKIKLFNYLINNYI